MQYKDNKILQLNKVLGLIMKDIRIKKTGLSCSKLANEYGLDRGNLNRVENGLVDSKISTIWKASEALGLKFSEVAKILEENLPQDFTLIDE